MTDTPWLGDACSLVDAFRSGERKPADELEAVSPPTAAQVLWVTGPEHAPALPLAPIDVAADWPLPSSDLDRGVVRRVRWHRVTPSPAERAKARQTGISASRT